MMDEFVISYRLQLPGQQTFSYEVRLNSATLSTAPPAGEPPAWAALAHHKCPHCPLHEADHPWCPAARRLAPLAAALGDLPSYEQITVEIITPQRTIQGATTAQRAISSLLGVVIAASDCPHTRFFRPMARFHLPLASEEETIYRAAASYLLAQYFLHRDGGGADWDLGGLGEIYQNVQRVNAGLAARLRGASPGDTSVNAIVLLDLLAKGLPYSIEDSLEDIRYLFVPYLANLTPLPQG